MTVVCTNGCLMTNRGLSIRNGFQHVNTCCVKRVPPSFMQLITSLFPSVPRLLQIDPHHQYDMDLHVTTHWGYDEEPKHGFPDSAKNDKTRNRTKAVQTVYPAQTKSSV